MIFFAWRNQKVVCVVGEVEVAVVDCGKLWVFLLKRLLRNKVGIRSDE